MPSIFTLEGPALGQAMPAAGQCSIQPGQRVMIGSLARVYPNPAGPYVDCAGIIGLRPPNEDEWKKIQGCAGLWATYGPQASAKYDAWGKINLAPHPQCGKTNYTTPSDYFNFYRDAAIEKLFSAKSGQIMVLKNNPTWIQTALNKILQNCTYATVAAGAFTGGTAAIAIQAGCAIAVAGGAATTGPGVPPPGGEGATVTRTGLSTPAKVAIGVGAAGILGTIGWLLLK